MPWSAPRTLCDRTLPLLEIPAGEIDKRWPVWAGRVSAAVLSPGNVAVNQRGFDRGKRVRAELSSAEQTVHGPRGDPCSAVKPLGGEVAFSFCGAAPPLERTIDGVSTISAAARFNNVASFIIGLRVCCMCFPSRYRSELPTSRIDESCR